ncbi:MAG: endolytic transglycosylase MltG [Thermotogae bacterium]|nr:endolytic transglycosylase MltG [Thermotogota bacterium]
MRRATLLLVLLTACGTNAGEEVRITYRRGESLGTFLRALKDSNVIRDERLLRVLVRLGGIERKIRPGLYVFRRGEGIWRVYEKLREGPKVRYFKFVIKEGESLKDFLPRLGRYGYDTSYLLSLAHDSLFLMHLSRKFPFLRGKKTLEGFMYPETYFVDYGASEEEVFIPPLEKFRKVWDSLDVERRSRKVGLSPYEVLILASIVEKEAVLDEEKPIIASVFLNRLKRGMPLAADPTVKYVLKNPPKLLSRRDVGIDSPYNTYRYPGLPPTPICSPTAKSIEAVLEPAKTDYLFFASADGRRHRFARTYREHLRNVRRMRLK